MTMTDVATYRILLSDRLHCYVIQHIPTPDEPDKGSGKNHFPAELGRAVIRT